MGPGLIALILFLSLCVIWPVVLKRDIGEALIISFVATALFGGVEAPRLMWEGLVYAATSEIFFAVITFVFMAYMIQQLGITPKLIEILNSILGRLPGSSAYVATLGGALFGMLSPSGSGNQAVVGSITVPWMVDGGFNREFAAAVSAGNSGFGLQMPLNLAMFMMLGYAPIAEAIPNVGKLVTAMYVAVLYLLIYRFLVVAYVVKRDGIKAPPPEQIMPFKKALSEGWTSLLIFLGILIPVLLTLGPISTILKANPGIGEAGVKSVSIMIWVPVLILFISLAVGREKLPKDSKSWYELMKKAAPSFSELAVLILFAFAVGETLTKLGLVNDLTDLIEMANLNKWQMVLAVGAMVVILAGPLSGSATIVMVGLFSWTALTSVGLDPIVAVIVFITCVATEGSSPPSSAQIFVASGMAGAEPMKAFIPLMKYYMFPPYIIACLMGLGILPLPL